MKNLFIILIILCSCNKKPTPVNYVPHYEDSVLEVVTSNETIPTNGVITESEIDYFYQLITVGSELELNSNYSVKYKKDIYIHILGEEDSVYVNEVKKIVAELNLLIDDIEIYITDDYKKCNLYLFLLDSPEMFIRMCKLNKERSNRVKRVGGLVTCNKDIDRGEINYCATYVKTSDFSVDYVRSIIREELTQSLGFFKDCDGYPNSVFHQTKSYAITEFTELDKSIIKKHYSN